MKRVLHIFKECDIKNVLWYLTAGHPKKKHIKKVERYYSVYCLIIESWTPIKEHDVIITSFKQEGTNLGSPIYSFRGVFDYCKTKSMHERPIIWDEVLSGELEVLIPDCITKFIDEDSLAAFILHQIENVLPEDIPIRYNKILFDAVKELCDNESFKLVVLEKALERQFNYQVDKRCVENAILEYNESESLVIKWGDLLGESEDYVFEQFIIRSSDREELENRMSVGALPSVYEWFYKLDRENSPDLWRCAMRRRNLRSAFESITLSDYKDVVNEHMRIIVEANHSYEYLPVVYICNQYGEKVALSDVSLSKLLCMDIVINDESIREPSQVLAVLIFYMEYPLRINRIMKKYMIQALLGMKFIHERDKHGEREIDITSIRHVNHLSSHVN